jgi:hypothetical protein
MTPLQRRRAHVRLLRTRVAVGSAAATVVAGGLVAVVGAQPAATQASRPTSAASGSASEGWSDVQATDDGASSSSSTSAPLTTGQS